MNEIISKEIINTLPAISYSGNVVIVHTCEDAELCASELINENVFGFDSETKPVFVSGKENKVSIIQIAGKSKVWIFHILQFQIGPKLKNFLENEKFLKVGVAIGDDVKKIRRCTGVSIQGVFDLSTLAKKKGLAESGLKTLTGRLLNARLSKRQQTSNWETFPLTEAQIIYAATDAWVCREIYVKLLSLEDTINP